MTDPKPEQTPDGPLTPIHPTETIEPPLSPKDQADLDALSDDPPSYHTILEIWREILKPALEEQKQPVGPGWATRITAMYPQIRIQQMKEFRERYFSKVAEMGAIVDYEISLEPEALDRKDIESDSEGNREHYKSVLFLWQAQILQWEVEWDCEDEFSAVELGAISEVHKMFFNETGFVAYLDNIGLRFNEDDQAEMTAALNEQREEMLADHQER